jgi:hypothetical protein
MNAAAATAKASIATRFFVTKDWVIWLEIGPAGDMTRSRCAVALGPSISSMQEKSRNTQLPRD